MVHKLDGCQTSMVTRHEGISSQKQKERQAGDAAVKRQKGYGESLDDEEKSKDHVLGVRETTWHWNENKYNLPNCNSVRKSTYQLKVAGVH